MCGKSKEERAVEDFADAYDRFVAAEPGSGEYTSAVLDMSGALVEYEGGDVALAKAQDYTAEHGMTRETFRAYMAERLDDLMADYDDDDDDDDLDDDLDEEDDAAAPGWWL